MDQKPNSPFQKLTSKDNAASVVFLIIIVLCIWYAGASGHFRWSEVLLALVAAFGIEYFIHVVRHGEVM